MFPMVLEWVINESIYSIFFMTTYKNEDNVIKGV